MWRGEAVDRLSDEALLSGVALGDDAAATAFVRRFQRRVFGLAVSITGDPSLAEDVAQQAFERAWRHGASYDARRASVATWLLTITRNLAIDHVRLRRAAPVDPQAVADLLAGAHDRHAVDPADGVAVNDEVDRVRRLMATLPAEQQRALVLATVLCRTSTEIAEIEGIPVPTAKHRIQSAVRKLRAAALEPDP